MSKKKRHAVSIASFCIWVDVTWFHLMIAPFWCGCFQTTYKGWIPAPGTSGCVEMWIEVCISVLIYGVYAYIYINTYLYRHITCMYLYIHVPKHTCTQYICPFFTLTCQKPHKKHCRTVRLWYLRWWSHLATRGWWSSVLFRCWFADQEGVIIKSPQSLGGHGD